MPNNVGHLLLVVVLTKSEKQMLAVMFSVLTCYIFERRAFSQSNKSKLFKEFHSVSKQLWLITEEYVEDLSPRMKLGWIIFSFVQHLSHRIFQILH